MIKTNKKRSKIMKHNLQRKSRKIWVLLTWLIAVALLLSGCGQAKPKVYHVGILSGFDFPVTDGFKDGMAKLGYIEGENVIYDLQETHGVDMQAYQDITQKFVGDKVDVIMSFPSEASQVAHQVTEGSGVPLVFSFAAIDGLGIVESVQAPGGNVTGVRYPLLDIARKHFEVTMQLVPDAKKVLIPTFRDYPIEPPQFETIEPLAEAAGVTIVKAPVVSGEEMQAFFDDLLAEGEPDIDAILYLVGPAPVSPDIVSVVAQFGEKYQIPITTGVIGENDTWTITDINVDFYESGEMAATLADKILHGIPAGTIPVVTPEPFLYINLIATQKLGLEVPEEMMLLADKVITQ
jgi:putative ABC transport system substrate-binding protein